MLEPDDSERMESRMSFLENEELSLVNRSKLKKEEIDDEFEAFNHAIESLKHKTHELKKELAHLNNAFQAAVKLLRMTISKADIEVVDKKVNAWSPDKLETRKEFLKMLKENK